MPELLSAVAAVVQRDFQLARSYRGRLVSSFLGPVFSITIFYYVSRLVRVQAFSPDTYFAFTLVGLITLQFLISSLNTPPLALRQELVAGTFERIVVSPFGAVGALMANLVFPFLFALAVAAFMVGFAAIAFHVSLSWPTAALAPPAGVLMALAFMPFALLSLAAVVVVKQASAGTTWVVLAMSLVAGLYFPVTILPGWIEWASDVQPFTPAVDLMRHLLVGRPLEDSAWLSLVKLAGFAVVLLPPAAWAVAAAVRLGRRRGTIIEY